MMFVKLLPSKCHQSKRKEYFYCSCSVRLYTPYPAAQVKHSSEVLCVTARGFEFVCQVSLVDTK